MRSLTSKSMISKNIQFAVEKSRRPSHIHELKHSFPFCAIITQRHSPSVLITCRHSSICSRRIQHFAQRKSSLHLSFLAPNKARLTESEIISLLNMTLSIISSGFRTLINHSLTKDSFIIDIHRFLQPSDWFQCWFMTHNWFSRYCSEQELLDNLLSLSDLNQSLTG
jgi:hypothetical protein